MAPLNDDIYFATIGELNAKLRAGELSAVELARGFAERLEKAGPRYNALALSLGERALRQARDIDDELKRKRFRGPLQGIPYGAKDLLSVAKLPTTWGAKPYAAQVFDFDAAVIERLRRANAVLVGKLAMVELAGGGGYRYAAASMFGPGLNPWNRGCWSGGSSSGSGSAVAAGLVPFAIGSETWGSILTPSAYCGVTGLRPTYGLVSRYGAMALSWSMDKIGPMCRSAEDCGMVLSAIAGGDSRDPGSAGKGYYYAPQLARPPKELRVGFAPVDFDEWAAPSARPDFLKALETLKELGVSLKETSLPEFPYAAVAGSIIDCEGASVFETLIQSGRVNELADQKQIAGLKAALEIPAKEYLRAMRVRRLIEEALARLMVDFDVLVSPSRLAPATKISEPISVPRQTTPKQTGLSQLGAAGNLAGLPALSLPCGFADGLPIAIQIVSRAFTENMLIALGREFQARTDWHKRRPVSGV